MKNKGFTLVELLAVMIILALITSIVFPVVTVVVNTSKNTIYDKQINKILNAAYDYTLEKIKLLPNDNETSYIMVSELKKYGYIENDIVDPKTNEKFPAELVVSVKSIGNDYKVTKSKNAKVKGNYLYTVEFGLIETNNKPQIMIEGFEGDVLVYNLNITEEFISPKYSSISSDGKDITDRVVQNIIYDNKIVDSIDVNRAGIYYVNYCVVDLKGYSDCKVLSVIVNDLEGPSLILPGDETISTSVTNFDLMDGVSCTDNSGKCDIKINGKINYGTAGAYIIEYISSDPTGNTTIKQRVITIE